MRLKTICALIFAAGAAIPAVSQSRPVSADPAPLGKLVDVGGHRVYLYCTGQGSPTVLVVGAGFSFDWGLVQPEISKLTRICTYDVSGTAWSEPGPNRACRDRTS